MSLLYKIINKQIILLLFFHFTLNLFSQSAYYYDINKSLWFVNKLYCEEDFVRVIHECNRILNMDSTAKENFNIYFLTGKSFQRLGYFDSSNFYFRKILDDDSLGQTQVSEQILRNYYLSDGSVFPADSEISILKNRYRFYDLSLKIKNFISVIIDELNLELTPTEKFFLTEQLNMRENLPIKSPYLAGILSSIIPGSGKFYTKQYSDGITSFFLITLTGFLSIHNFSKGNNSSGILFSIPTLFFYAGNVYGSITSAKRYNEMIKLNFAHKFDEYLKNNSFLYDEINYCR